MRRLGILGLSALAALGLASAPVAAQVRTVDPNSAIDGDLRGQQAAPPSQSAPIPGPQGDTPPPPPPEEPVPADVNVPQNGQQGGQAPAPAPAQQYGAAPAATQQPGTTYEQGDVLDAAEGVFGRGAKGLAEMIEKILKDQGRPNGYIAGHEAAGAIGIGLRYGSGTLSHKIEGQRKVYWTGPSIGFDLGGDATKVFVLVYNLYDTQDLYKRFPSVEGRVYFVGGFSATYLRRGNIVLIPVRLGVGWRLGANIGYMKFTEKSRILPF